MTSARISDLTVTTLADVLVYNTGVAQTGFSILLEFLDAKGAQRRVIFDTADYKEGLLRNIGRLKLDLKDLDAIVLSHGHPDHTGATVEVLKLTEGRTKVFAHPHTFLPKFVKHPDGRRSGASVPVGEGISEIEEAGGHVIFNTGPVEIFPGLWTTGEVPRKSFETVIHFTSGAKLVTDVEGKEIDDMVWDDNSLWAHVDLFGPVVFVGCAHAGSLNILEHVKNLGGFNDISGLIGGIHMLGRPDDYVERTIQGFKKYGFKLLSPTHCTGWKATVKFSQQFPDSFVLNYVLRKIKFGEKNDPIPS